MGGKRGKQSQRYRMSSETFKKKKDLNYNKF